MAKLTPANNMRVQAVKGANPLQKPIPVIRWQYIVKVARKARIFVIADWRLQIADLIKRTSRLHFHDWIKKKGRHAGLPLQIESWVIALSDEFRQGW
jgi:hypothetical protein